MSKRLRTCCGGSRRIAGETYAMASRSPRLSSFRIVGLFGEATRFRAAFGFLADFVFVDGVRISRCLDVLRHGKSCQYASNNYITPVFCSGLSRTDYALVQWSQATTPRLDPARMLFISAEARIQVTAKPSATTRHPLDSFIGQPSADQTAKRAGAA